jgi:hypothetical protein
MAYMIVLVLSTVGIIPNRLHDSFKLLNLRPAVCILMQKALELESFRQNSEQEVLGQWDL